MLGIGIAYIALSSLLVAIASDTVGTTVGIIGITIGVAIVTVYGYLTDKSISDLTSAVERLDKELKKVGNEDNEHH